MMMGVQRRCLAWSISLRVYLNLCRYRFIRVFISLVYNLKLLIMKNLLYLLFVLPLLFSCGDDDANEDKWYVGGTLHKSNLKEWKSASDKDKLATCADFVASNKDYEGDMDKMKSDAQELLDCINEVAISSELENEKTSATAAACVLLLKIN